ncbi:EamA family transporter RarD [Marinagarivorans cellulosilyticus]|uniref:Chloramphenicol-sensitive protein RarD n=1 Tax=Marinagarivorans cellulosilyticus TaxID=2721545 RepID=A0AAN2BM79_9GAMM|nr:EamA family transporter RarD [Marinagarivorans cellulosilyticus]BCD99888.1 chloramphenicol-sensitive protein RarD [Marinagarivorans cellulosilyticus]
MTQQFKHGLLLAVFTYAVWGLFPLYFKLLAGMPADEIVVHRIIWSAFFTVVLLLAVQRLKGVRHSLCDIRLLGRLALSAMLLLANWLIFIYATLADDVLQLSLGYYINPLFNMLFGFILFKERTHRMGIIAIGLVFTGLAIQFAQVDKFPILAVLVALVFSLYGVVRKGLKVDALTGLFIETLILLIPGLIYLFCFTSQQSITAIEHSYYWLIVLVLAGPITSIPLITFSAAVTRIPYYLMGFCQYITPTMMFAFAIFLYHETWNRLDIVTFMFVWAGIICMVIGTWQANKKPINLAGK